MSSQLNGNSTTARLKAAFRHACERAAGLQSVRDAACAFVRGALAAGIVGPLVTVITPANRIVLRIEASSLGVLLKSRWQRVAPRAGPEPPRAGDFIVLSGGARPASEACRPIEHADAVRRVLLAYIVSALPPRRIRLFFVARRRCNTR